MRSPPQKPDLNKGSYYANPLVDVPNVTAAERDADPMYYRQNVWPNPKEKGLEKFEVAFKECVSLSFALSGSGSGSLASMLTRSREPRSPARLGKFIFDVGLLLAKACESFGACSRQPSADLEPASD
jgi:hypothetical protein